MKQPKILWLAPGVNHAKPTSGGILYSAHFLNGLRETFGDASVSELDLAYNGSSWLLNRLVTNWRYLVYLISAGHDHPDLIIVNCDSNAHLLLPAIVLRLCSRVPILMTVYHLGGVVEGRRGINSVFRRKAEQLFLLCATSIITISRSTYGALHEMYRRSGVKAVRTDIIFPGIDLQARSIRRPRNGSEVCNLLYVGTCDDPRKGIETLIAAMAMLPRGRFNLQLAGTFTGSASRGQLLTKMLIENGLVQSVRFLGRVSDRELTDLYSESDIFVFPSFWEGYGIVLAEAMSYGLPIISTNAGAIPEIVRDGVNGVLVPPGDASGLCAAIVQLGLDSQRREEIGRRNLDAARRFASWRETRMALTGVVQREVNRGCVAI